MIYKKDGTVLLVDKPNRIEYDVAVDGGWAETQSDQKLIEVGILRTAEGYERHDVGVFDGIKFDIEFVDDTAQMVKTPTTVGVPFDPSLPTTIRKGATIAKGALPNLSQAMLDRYGITDEEEPAPEPPIPPTLEELKVQAIADTDAETAANIVGGFGHAGQTFSSSIAAQENFKGEKIAQLDGRGYPTQWSLINGGVYSITGEAVWNDLYLAAEEHVRNTKVAGLVKRGQIAACATVAELNTLMGW